MIVDIINDNILVMRYKKKLNISSLGAAICNVAVFKGMKER